LSVRVQCPHCRSVCQIGKQYLGSSVQCGKCGRLFALPAAVPQPVSAPAPSVPPAPVEDEELVIELDGPTAAALKAVPTPAASRAAAPLAGACRLEIGGATSAGRVRPRNEDSYLVQHVARSTFNRGREVALVVVADGMGGHGSGDQASDLVVRAVGGALAGVFSTALGSTGEAPPLPFLAEQVDAALKAANRAVFQRSQQEASCRGMGATAAVVLVWEGTALIGHVGDCRVYCQHNDQLTQITRDQTLVARMVELGKMTPAEALTHPQRHEVTQAVGRGADLRPAAHQVKLSAGDWLIVACDGLPAHVDDRRLADAIVEAGPSASGLASYLVELANNGGGSDNCTVVAVRCF
jgi:PPM family protein phosphatase